MKKRRKHKAKKEQRRPDQTPPPLSPPPPPPPEHLRKRHWWEWVVGVLALAASVIGILLGVDWVRDQYAKTEPEIRVTESDPTSPFLFPFSVKNESPFFSMVETNWTCKIRDMEFGIGNRLRDIGLGGGPAKDIKPRSSENYRCRIIAAGPDIKSLNITVRVEYKTLGVARYRDAPFEWAVKASVPRWIEGKIN